MKPMVFVDLEETLIVSWHDRMLCNVKRVNEIFRSNNIDEIHIFSFAIDNDMDKAVFEDASFKGWLEEAFAVKIVSVPTVQEIMRTCMCYSGNRFEMYEFKSVWGKLRAFHDFCNGSFKDRECWLLDDVVPNSIFVNHDTNVCIKTIRI